MTSSKIASANTPGQSGRAVRDNDRISCGRISLGGPGAVFDGKLRQLRMTGETAAAAVTELRADLPNVTSRDLCAARGAIGIRARGAIVDENEAEHVGPPLEFRRVFIGASAHRD
jgi:hypothetical protein